MRDASATAVYLLRPEEVVHAPLPALASAPLEQLQSDFSLQSLHRLTGDPTSADVVLAPIQLSAYGRCFEILRSSEFYREHAAKVVMYSLDANQFPALRGLYPSVSRRWVRGGWALPAHYVSTHYTKHRFEPEELQNKDILFSFVGSSRTHAVREKILRWRHSRFVGLDSSPRSEKQYWWEKPNKEEFSASFREVTRRSRFVVCPRGISPASVRVYEAMEAAAVPIIVADEGELPLGPAWAEFSLRVAQRDVDSIPLLVERLQDRAEAMGMAARQAWETYFSPQAGAVSMVRWARRLVARSQPRPLALQLAENTRPRLLKGRLRHALSRAGKSKS